MEGFLIKIIGEGILDLRVFHVYVRENNLFLENVIDESPIPDVLARDVFSQKSGSLSAGKDIEGKLLILDGGKSQ